MTEPTIASTIDAMVAAGAGFDNIATTPTGGMVYDSVTDTVQTIGDAPFNASARISDPGTIDIEHEAGLINGRLNLIAAQLEEQTFDNTTGKPSFKLPEGSDGRNALLTRFEREKVSATYDLTRLQQLHQQRESDKIAAEAARNEHLAIQAFANGDQNRAAAMEEALLRAEADSAAQAIVSGRRAQQAKR
jgi:hypothetical protein